MWKDYSSGYIRHNRASGISVIVGVFIASLFLSFLCSLFYNFWVDDIAGIISEEGDWQGRISGELNEEELEVIRRFANVEKAVVNSELSGENETVVDLLFYNAGTIYEDMSSIIHTLGLKEDAADYHYRLLAMYFIRIPGDEAPRLLMPAYLAVILVVCVSMILLIHTSFAVSMNNRVHQFGIFSSIGATPRQIRVCLMQETVVLAFVPVLAGILAGIGISYGAVYGMNVIRENLAEGRAAVFQYHPAIFAATFLSSAFTVLFSAWLPARKLSRLTPLEAIRGTGEMELKKKKHSRILSALFGMEGELVGNALKAQKKALRTTALSLTLSFLGFMVTQCFFTLSGISTNHTYFSRYQNVWDVMVTVKDTKIEEFQPVHEIQGLSGIRSGVVYQKGEAQSIVSKDAISEELLALGGVEAVAGPAVSSDEKSFYIKAPVVILDDQSFLKYCEQAGITPGLNGGIVVNRIWDSIHSVFRYREYVPFITENKSVTTLKGSISEESPVEIPVLGYTRELPVLREQYDDYTLVHVVPLSLWKEVSGVIGGTENDMFVRLLAAEGASIDELNDLQERTGRILGREYAFESENRLQEKLTNDEMIDAFEIILGSFCFLLAVIGIANVFSNTLGFLRQRRREFARYMSVGLTPEGLRRMFFIEALAVAGRPLLITLPLTVFIIALMIKFSYLDPAEFLAVAPVVPILVFILAVFGFVALAYYLGGRRVLRSSLFDALCDDTMM